MTVALITGCSTGIGHAAARRFAAAGYTTVATARRPEALEDLARLGCTTLRLDVTDEASLKGAVTETIARHHMVDVLVNNAGYAEMGPVELVSLDGWRRQLETNVIGPVALIQLVLPAMREAGRGRIINVSSMGGEVTFPGGGAYHASKYALEAISDALRMETAPWGVAVSVVQPGPAATSFDVNSADQTPFLDGPYATLAAEMDRQVRAFTPRGADPDRIAKVIVRAAQSRRPRARYRVGLIAKSATMSRRLSPDPIWDAAMRFQFRRAWRR